MSLGGSVFSPKSGNIDELYDLLASCVTKYEDILIMGDFNCNLMKKSASSDSFARFFRNMNLTILPLKATHITRDTETWIDHILSNPERTRSQGQLSVPGISKHDLIYVSYHLKWPKYTPKIIKYRDYKNFDAISFLSDGFSVPWNLVQNETSLNGKVAVFTEMFNGLVNRHTTKDITRDTSRSSVDIR